MKPEPRPSLSLNWVRKPEYGCAQCCFRAPHPEQHCGEEMSPVIHTNHAAMRVNSNGER